MGINIKAPTHYHCLFYFVTWFLQAEKARSVSDSESSSESGDSDNEDREKEKEKSASRETSAEKQPEVFLN